MCTWSTMIARMPAIEWSSPVAPSPSPRAQGCPCHRLPVLASPPATPAGRLPDRNLAQEFGSQNLLRRALAYFVVPCREADAGAAEESAEVDRILVDAGVSREAAAPHHLRLTGVVCRARSPPPPDSHRHHPHHSPRARGRSHTRRRPSGRCRAGDDEVVTDPGNRGKNKGPPAVERKGQERGRTGRRRIRAAAARAANTTTTVAASAGASCPDAATVSATAAASVAEEAAGGERLPGGSRAAASPRSAFAPPRGRQSIVPTMTAAAVGVPPPRPFRLSS